MNYYPHHIGDYLTATAHLSWLEDAAYRRLLDVYYSRECPLPDDTAKVCRLVRAQTKEEKQAVLTVLDEFFHLSEYGWCNARADEEIQKANESGQASAAKDGNERDRMKRFRERRAAMFAALREYGIVPPYNIAMPELQRLHDTTCNAPETLQGVTGNEAATRTDTTVQSQSHYPIPINTDTSSLNQPSSRDRAPPGDDEKPNSPAEWIAVFAEQHGVDVDHRSFHDRKKFWPLAAAWTNAGVTVGQMRSACAKAHADAKEPIAWLPAYADRVLSSMQAERKPAPQRAEPHWRQEQRARTMAAVPGIAAPGMHVPTAETIDVEAKNVTAIALG